jgi:hypothetical protein
MNLEEYFNRLQKRAKQQKDEADADKGRNDSASKADMSRIERFLNEGKRDFN